LILFLIREKESFDLKNLGLTITKEYAINLINYFKQTLKRLSLKDFKAISRNYFGKIKSSLGMKTEYAKSFKEADSDYYLKVFDSKPLILKDFLKFLNGLQNIKSVLEVGCSTGIFPIRYFEYFQDFEYTGLDISQKNIVLILNLILIWMES